jgi:broad specificity phosphatase PhoE
VLHGQSDPPLTPTGRRQARAAAEALAALPVAALYASDLRRARATAALAARRLGLEVQCLKELRERHFGAWEGTAVSELARREPEALAALWGDAAFAPPGGESMDALGVRVLEAVDGLVTRHRGGTVAVFGHGGAHRAVLGRVLGLGPAALLRLALDPGHAAVVRCFPDGAADVAALNLPPAAWG